jgi:glutamine---fructose-6-phosphate transaminase (isomerizing)
MRSSSCGWHGSRERAKVYRRLDRTFHYLLSDAGLVRAGPSACRAPRPPRSIGSHLLGVAVTNVPAWHTPIYPEFRESPPWVMEDMIQLEPRLADDLRRLDSELQPLVEVTSRTIDAGGPIVVVGCGTAWHAALAFADVLSEALGGSHLAEGRQSFDAALDPRHDGLCIAVSNGGRSKATLDALEAARSTGATTALVTADPAGPLSRAADVIVESMTGDDSWCHTIAYLAPIVVGAALGARLKGEPIDADALRAASEASIAATDDARAIAQAFDGVARILTVGSGADAVAARELSLKVEEAAYIPATTHQTENLLHGHLVPCDETCGLVVLATDRRQRSARVDRAAAVLRAARSLDVRTAAIVTSDVAAEFHPDLTSAGRIAVRDLDALPASLSSYVSTAAAFQYIAVGLADCVGANPDFIRRDFASYRRAYDLADHKYPREPPPEP